MQDKYLKVIDETFKGEILAWVQRWSVMYRPSMIENWRKRCSRLMNGQRVDHAAGDEKHDSVPG